MSNYYIFEVQNGIGQVFIIMLYIKYLKCDQKVKK